MSANKRREKLIKPRLQLKIVFMFFVVSILAVGIQSVLMSRSLGAFAEGDSERMYALLRENLLVTLLALLPATLIVGAITTFRIAGPLYRFERFLEAIERGENPEDCVIRQNDDLQDFCGLLNRVSRPWRSRQAVETGEPSIEVEEVASLVSDSAPESESARS